MYLKIALVVFLSVFIQLDCFASLPSHCRNGVLEADEVCDSDADCSESITTPGGVCNFDCTECVSTSDDSDDSDSISASDDSDDSDSISASDDSDDSDSIPWLPYDPCGSYECNDASECFAECGCGNGGNAAPCCDACGYDDCAAGGESCATKPCCYGKVCDPSDNICKDRYHFFDKAVSPLPWGF